MSSLPTGAASFLERRFLVQRLVNDKQDTVFYDVFVNTKMKTQVHQAQLGKPTQRNSKAWLDTRLSDRAQSARVWVCAKHLKRTRWPTPKSRCYNVHGTL